MLRIKRDCTKKKSFCVSLRKIQNTCVISSLSFYLRDSYEKFVCCTFGPRLIRVSPESRSIYSCTGQPAPESVTPSVDLRRFPANFMSKIALKNNISCINVFFKIFLDIFHNFVYAIMTKPLHLQTANCKGLHRNRSLQEVPRGYPVQ